MKNYSFLFTATLFQTLCLSGLAQVKITVVTNGPSPNRLNLTLISEGYRDSEAAQFRADATNVVNVFLAAQPYAEYRSYFNATAVFVPSNESGSDHVSYPSYKDTFFNSSYDSSDRFVTIPNSPLGLGKVAALLQSYAPETDVTIMIVNDLVFGGAGGPVLITSKGASAPEIVVHESGHTLAGLGDEYEDFFPGYPDVEEPNTTRETSRNLIKWKAWISPATPIPTPATDTYANQVGLFQGAHYQSTGWYRPKLDCAMRTLGVPFCEVCSEALVIAINKNVRTIESFSPATTNVSIGATNTLQFQITRLQPASHELAVQWFTNGVALAGETNLSFQLATGPLVKGAYNITAEVRDTTPLVRTDSENALVRSVTWRVTKPVSPPGPFDAVKGKFRGLVSATNQTRLDNSGLLTMTLADSGAFSGKLIFPVLTLKFNGQFNSANQAQVALGTGHSAFQLTLNLNLDELEIVGELAGNNSVAQLRAVRETTNAVAAKYTFLIPGNNESESPKGDGFGTAALKSEGTLRLGGSLSDGMKFKAVGKISNGGEFPLFVRLDGGHGVLFGWLSLTNDAMDGLALSWLREGGGRAKLYPNGFTNETSLAGDRYAPPSADENAVSLTNASLVLDFGNLDTAVTNAAVLQRNQFVFLPDNSVSLALIPATGLLKGKFLHPVSGKSTLLQGVVLQQRSSGGGFFLGTSESGRITLRETVP